MTDRAGDGASTAMAAPAFAGPATGEPGPFEPKLLYLVKQLEQAIRSHLDDLLRPARLTVLERHPDLSTAQLARGSFVAAQSMADMITTLEGRGLIERHRDRSDRRRLVVALTAEGRELLDSYRKQVDTLERQMLTGLTRPQISSLRRGLHTCRANLVGLSRG